MNKLTPYHAKYFAYQLTRQLPANDVTKLTASLQDAQVDLNPHQVEAALFAFKSPLSKGALLADEVGLGKTIEAGIILSQEWAERKRKLLIIAPSNLREQWKQEMSDKFYLPSSILESKSFNTEIKNGNLNPFDQEDNIIICSFHFAKNKAPYLQNVNWDLVIIDEAHRLRNVYKPSNKIGNAIKSSLSHCKKVLLTATPLQNYILELYGLVSLIDPYIFGDLKSFKSQYSRLVSINKFDELRERLQPICQRTLRRQVLEYIRYTKRIPLVEEFIPTEEEKKLYHDISDYLYRPKLYALPNSQRQLVTLILRKLLASSTYAIYGTLDALVKKLEAILDRFSYIENEDLAMDFETYDEVEDEWSEEYEESEFVESESFTLEEIEANKKALVFTESRRTQDFLCDMLEARGYAGKVVKFNGSNNDSKSREIYKDYVKKHQGTDMLSGSPTSDKRAAIVSHFKEHATIMVATEAAAEGINLQFCSLVVNFDLPWNPQRIEQRIGRCHRYGQKYDVVVINFLNRNNAADQRVYELLDQKFRLFDGVFGASDEVLGSLGNGVDFEKRIAKIYQECRSTEDIESAFNELQEELKPDISEKIKGTRKVLLENFDQEVAHKLKTNQKLCENALDQFEKRLWWTTKYYLDDYATFDDNQYSFTLNKNPFPQDRIHAGPYLILKPEAGQRKSDVDVPHHTNIYRAGHALAKRILQECKKMDTFTRQLFFDYSGTPGKITALEPYLGQSGFLQIKHLEISSFEDEDYLVVGCVTEEGEVIEPGLSLRIFSIPASQGEKCYVPEEMKEHLDQLIYAGRSEIITENAVRNKEFFDAEIDKLDLWADDIKLSLDKEIKDLDAEIKLKKSEAKKMLQLDAKVKAQRAIKNLEKKRREKRMRLYEAQDQVDERKEKLLDEIEARLSQEIKGTELFTIKWTLR